MEFKADNEIVKLCAEGMELEGLGKNEDAAQKFNRAWEKASTDFEKFTAAHYVARHQKSVEGKLDWDKAALDFALKVENDGVKAVLPSLYLNIAKCYEDLGEQTKAIETYELGLSFSNHLLDDGYGKMIKGGLLTGLARLT